MTDPKVNIYLEKDGLKELKSFVEQHYSDKKIVLFCDENTQEYCLPNLILEGGSLFYEVEIVTVPAGEESKSFSIVEELIAAMLEMKLDRHTVLLLLGGGVVGDLGAFVASIFKRGIPFVQIPTTLLAMIDASIGGKTAINMGSLKNQVGTFNHADAVFIHPPFLETLTARELSSGFAEMLKHALISDISVWKEVSAMDDLSHIDADLIFRSASIKKDIVENDFKEYGIRKRLNFGHTVGHGIESLSHEIQDKTHPMLHGEAIAWGMVVEAKLSLNYGLSQIEFNDIQSVIKHHFTKPKFSAQHIERILELMTFDKKNKGKAIGFVVLNGIGRAQYDVFISLEKTRKALQEILS